MADGLTLNAGSGGATLLTDDTGVGGHAQVVKLAISTDGSGTLIPADATNGIDVDVTRLPSLPAGTNNIGDVDVASIAAGDNLVGRVKISDGTDVALVTVGGALTVDGSGVTQPVSNAGLTALNGAIAGTEVQVDVVGALPAGGNAIGKLAANSGVDIGDVDVTSIAAGTNSIGNVGVIPRASGGMTIFRSIDIDETEEEIKATAGQVFSIAAFNVTASPLYLKFYNATAANVTVGSTTPVLTFVVPGNADSDGAGFVWNNEIGFAFGTAITVACTTAVADNDTGAPAANACIINVGYA